MKYWNIKYYEGDEVNVQLMDSERWTGPAVIIAQKSDSINVKVSNIKIFPIYEAVTEENGNNGNKVTMVND